MAIRYGVQVRGTSGRRLLVVRLEYSMIFLINRQIGKQQANKRSPSIQTHSGADDQTKDGSYDTVSMTMVEKVVRT